MSVRHSADPESALHSIQRLQFIDTEEASRQLLAHFRDALPLPIVDASIIPRAVSLNSISGTLSASDGTTYFFKTHVEPDSILREYYNAQLLEEAGYPIIRPVWVVRDPGRQIVVYPFVTSRSMFDALREAEQAQRVDADLLRLQEDSDRLLFDIYERTIATTTSDEGADSPIHQLFHHRLCGQRFRDFYEHGPFTVGGQEVSFADLARLRWRINGVEYRQTLGELIHTATTALLPTSSWQRTVIGHGDAHNGNVFYDTTAERLVYFDPAFAGRHSPLLDIVKPLFHNVFATWMYHPEEVDRDLDISCKVTGDAIDVVHNYTVSPLRREVLRLKVTHALIPLLRGHYARGDHDEWSRVLKSALMCCPLLTVNLTDRARYSDRIALLGLSQAIDVGADIQSGESLLDSMLRQV